MRAGSLSNTRIISLLNSYFVPVYTSNEDFRPGGCATAEEKSELSRIHQEGYAANLSVGTVHAYVLNSDGKLIDSLHTAGAAKPEVLIAMLERAVQTLGPKAGETVVKPAPKPTPKAEGTLLLLQLVSRYLIRTPQGFALTGQEEGGTGWASLPSEDLITVAKSEWTKLLPPGPCRVGTTWEVDSGVASTILKHFYPPTENWDLSTNRIDEQSLHATVISTEKATTHARIEGSLRMKHPFYHRDDDRFVRTSIAGYLVFEEKTRRILTLRIVTDDADYTSGGGDQPFGVALRSVP